MSRRPTDPDHTDVMTRRALCRLGAVLPMLGFLPPQAAKAQSAASAVDYDSFVAHLDELRAFMPPDAPLLQNSYVHRAATNALAVTEFPVPRLFPMGSFRGVEIGPIRTTAPFLIIRYRLAPGALLPPHDHPNYSVATVGISGEAHVTQFEIEGERPPHGRPGSFILRETAGRLLRHGDVVTLSPSRDNIHTFRAGPNGAEFVDLTTSHGPDVGFSYLNIAARPTGGSGDRYSAVWTRFE